MFCPTFIHIILFSVFFRISLVLISPIFWFIYSVLLKNCKRFLRVVLFFVFGAYLNLLFVIMIRHTIRLVVPYSILSKRLGWGRGWDRRLCFSDAWETKSVESASFEDPDPWSAAFLTSGSGMGKKLGSRSVMNNPDLISESIETIYNSLTRIRDPGWKKFRSGINIPDPQHWNRRF